MIVYFNDNCQAGINSRIRCCSFFPDEIRQIKIHLEKLPVHTELIENFSLVYVKFNSSALSPVVKAGLIKALTNKNEVK